MASEAKCDDLMNELRGLLLYSDSLPSSVVCSSYEKIIKDICRFYFLYRYTTFVKERDYEGL